MNVEAGILGYLTPNFMSPIIEAPSSFRACSQEYDTTMRCKKYGRKQKKVAKFSIKNLFSKID
jgi:hypothetical protein